MLAPDSASLLLRPATDTDGEALAALIASVFAEYPGCPFVRAEFPELDRPASHFARRGGGLWVMEDSAGPLPVAGSIAISRTPGTDTFELHKVYLARGLRGRGIGARLYATARDAALAAGARRLKLWTDTRFLDGHRFYERLGFRRLPVVRYLADATAGWEYAYCLDLEHADAGRSAAAAAGATP